jgi:elongation factor Ts
MAEISASVVKALRDQTGAGMMDCKRALADADGDLGRAGELLRERGLAKAVKREGRETSEGVIGLALAGGSGALVELACETDFVAKTEEFQKLASQLAAIVAADASRGTPEAMLDASIDGAKVSERIAAAIAKLGENVVLRRVARLASGGAGVVGGYVHAGGKLGVLVSLESKTGGAELEAMAKDLSMHVAAADPSPVAVDRSGVAKELVDAERAIFRAQAEQSGKPANIIEKMVEGRVNKYYAEVCLIEQPFVKDPDRTIGKLLADESKRLGRDVAVVGFVRFKLGEALGR